MLFCRQRIFIEPRRLVLRRWLGHLLEGLAGLWRGRCSRPCLWRLIVTFAVIGAEHLVVLALVRSRQADLRAICLLIGWVRS